MEVASGVAGAAPARHGPARPALSCTVATGLAATAALAGSLRAGGEAELGMRVPCFASARTWASGCSAGDLRKASTSMSLPKAGASSGPAVSVTRPVVDGIQLRHGFIAAVVASVGVRASRARPTRGAWHQGQNTSGHLPVLLSMRARFQVARQAAEEGKADDKEADGASTEEAATGEPEETPSEEIASEEGAGAATEATSAGEEEEAAGDAEDTAEEPEEEKPVAEKKPPKWTCSSCGASNFAASPECHKCGSPKPSMAEMALIGERNEAKEEVSKVMDSFLRLQADLQNYRRQHNESMSRAQDLGKQDALRQLVPFSLEVTEALVPLDNMTEKEQALFGSYSLLFNKVTDVYSKFGVEPLPVEVGEKFNPLDHRKAEEREAPADETPGTILEVLKPGWKCEGKVLIPSEVAIVAFPVEEDEEDEEEAMADEEGEEEDMAGEDEGVAEPNVSTTTDEKVQDDEKTEVKEEEKA